MRVQGCKNEPDLFPSQITLYRATKQVLSFLGLFSDGLLLRLCFNLLGVACFIWLCYYSTPVRVQLWNIVVSMSLSVYVSLSISQRTYVGTLLDFLYMLHLAIVAVFSGGIMIHYLTPVLWITLVGQAEATSISHTYMAAAFISCRLDYCNSLLYRLPDTLLLKLQSVQNATARLITGTRHSDHISPALRELHWLPIWECGKFKVARLVRQSPLYLADDCHFVSDCTRRSLRSADVSTCVVPRTLSSYGDRTFAAAGPRLWNSLPVQLRNPDITHGLFRWQLTPFSESKNTALCDFWHAAP